MRRKHLLPGGGPLPRPDLVAICAYLGRTAPRSVDGPRSSAEVHLDKLAAAARMQ